MSTQPTVNQPHDTGYENPFDAPLNSEIEESKQRQAATPPLHSGYINPFDEPLASEIAEQKHAEAGQVTNDVGNAVIVPKDGESFSDTLKRATQRSKSLSPEQRQAEIDKETTPKQLATKTAETLGAAAGIGVVGPALLAAPGELTEMAIKHLAGNVLPGMETQAAKQTLLQAIPYVRQLVGLGVGYEGLKHLLQAVSGGKK